MWLVLQLLMMSGLALDTRGTRDDYVTVDLRYGLVAGYNPYISFVRTPWLPPDYSGHACSYQAVLRVSLAGPYKGAKLELDYGEPPRLWTLDVSDSPASDGYGGHNGTTSDMAEAHIHNRQLRVYGSGVPDNVEQSTNGDHLLRVLDDVVKKGSRMWLDVSDERLEIGGPKGVASNQVLESPYLFDFSGQKVHQGAREHDLYIGLNRVIGSDHRAGSGLCKVDISLYEFAKDCERGTHNCHKDAECLSSRRAYRCKCKDGFYGDGKICVDDDECKFENGGCVHSCQNTPGNFTCSCYPGFTLASDGLDCIDKNECLENKGGCAQQCINTIGSFECRCNAGYSLHSDGKTCNTGTWCRTVMGCEHFCSSSSPPRCACRPGYKQDTDEKKCLQMCSVGNGGCQHICKDTTTGPVCSCQKNYILASDRQSCIASCAVKNGGCEKKCRDIPTGTVCSCPAGYQLHQDGRNCLDIDECQDGKNGGCSDQCINTHGSYECICPPGHKVSSDQKTCVDIDECAIKESCDHECINVPGSYKCLCRKGYQQYGVTHCADANECSVQNGGCQHTCTNTMGSYQCSCQTNYKLHPNGRDCVDAGKCIPLNVSPLASLQCSTDPAHQDQRCTLRCKENARFISLPGNEVIVTCGPATHFEWKLSGGNVTEIPTCSEKGAPLSYKRRATMTFIMKKCQFQNSSMEDLRSYLSGIFKAQKKYKCKKMCQVNFVNITCGTRVKTLKRLVRGTREELVTAEVEIQMNSKPPTDKCNSTCMSERTLKRFKRSFRKLQKTVGENKFHIKFESRDHKVLRRSFQQDKHVEETCSPGYVLVNKICVACSIGTYYDVASSTCLPCTAGTYQNREGKLRCKSCESDAITGPLGATSRKHCTELCAPGHFSSNGSVPCLPCPVGTYQPQAGRTTCNRCGPGMSTTQLAAYNFSHCRAKEVCKPGHFFDVPSSTCKPCPVGSYQPESGQNFCTSCPGTTLTDDLASTRLEDCKDRECGEYMGQYFGIIRTPNYPGNYPNNVNCVWRINHEKRRRILIIVPDIYLSNDDKCGDVLVMRKSKSPYSRITYETCASRSTPTAFTARSRKLWIQFKSDGNNTASGFSIPFVAYNEEYQSLIEDIVKDRRLYSSYQHQQIFKDQELLHALLEVIATPYNYLKYANVSRSMFPHSFFRLLTPKVRRFFSD